MRNVPAVLAALLVILAAPSLAHITTSVAPLAAPLVVGVPTAVEVTFSEPCFEVVPQEAQARTASRRASTPVHPRPSLGKGRLSRSPRTCAEPIHRTSFWPWSATPRP